MEVARVQVDDPFTTPTVWEYPACGSTASGHKPAGLPRIEEGNIATGVGVRPGQVYWHCGEHGHFQHQCHVIESGALVRRAPD